MKTYKKPIIREVYLDTVDDVLLDTSTDISNQESLSKDAGGGGNGGWDSWEED